MKMLGLTDDMISALKMAVEMSYDMENDMLTDDVPLTLTEIRSMSSKSDDIIKAELSEAREDLSIKLDHIMTLAVLRDRLSTL